MTALTAVAVWNLHPCARSCLILYQLILLIPCLSSLLSAGDASQNTIPLGECLCHLICLSVFESGSAADLYLIAFKASSGVFRTWLSPFYVQLLWYRALFCHGAICFCVCVNVMAYVAHSSAWKKLSVSWHIEFKLQPCDIWTYILITLINGLISITWLDFIYIWWWL